MLVRSGQKAGLLLGVYVVRLVGPHSRRDDRLPHTPHHLIRLTNLTLEQRTQNPDRSLTDNLTRQLLIIRERHPTSGLKRRAQRHHPLLHATQLEPPQLTNAPSSPHPRQPPHRLHTNETNQAPYAHSPHTRAETNHAPTPTPQPPHGDATPAPAQAPGDPPQAHAHQAKPKLKQATPTPSQPHSKALQAVPL